MDDALNGRKIYAKRGPATGGFQDASAEICNLSDTVAAAAEGKLILKDGRLLWLKEGQLIEVSINVLREFISTHVVSQRLVNQGTADKPNWALKFTRLQLTGPTLRTLLSPGTLRDGSLIPRMRGREFSVGQPLGILGRIYFWVGSYE
jgi:hypothetical protein